MYKSIIFSLLALLFFACDNGEKTKWETVMANHDVVMPMMGTTNKVRKNLKKLLTDTENLPTETTQKVNKLIANLDTADEGMMDWMNGFQQLEKLQNEKSHDEIMSYLDAQDKEIKKVGEDMTNSIQAGLAFIKKMDGQ